HRYAVTRRGRRHITSVVDDDWVDEMLMQMIDVFDNPAFERRAHGDVVEDGEMLHVLAESDAARVRTDRNAEFRRHQEHGKHFVHAAEATAVDLTKTNCLCLEKLLEQHAILTMLTSRNADWCDRTRDRRMSEDVVRARRLLDPPGIELRQ